MIIKPFKKLPVGIYRLFLAFWFILPIIIGVMVAFDATYPEEDFVIAFIPSFIAYWILARVALWVYEGFTEQNVNTETEKED